ncbi:hypothetical protein POM88_021947 [Heracleum sosnowskyi]|uniref:Uncharacterized protein n=1 Tax=Heracleum sosnowskyi TaxID=360622 RepID=A0AAD8MTA4_9APIA|nr:hypothetical protein POM88_021947 [Heracleum sosnowskyi]
MGFVETVVSPLETKQTLTNHHPSTNKHKRTQIENYSCLELEIAMAESMVSVETIKAFYNNQVHNPPKWEMNKLDCLLALSFSCGVLVISWPFKDHDRLRPKTTEISLLTHELAREIFSSH